MAEKFRVAMIGNGNVGSALAQGIKRAGYTVEMVGNEPKRVKEVAKQADLVVLAIPATEYENALKTMGDAIRGKVVVDVSNVLTEDSEFAGDLQQSHAEKLQRSAKGAKVVKAFNTVFAKHMATGKLNGEALTLFVAADDDSAKDRVLQVAKDIGFDGVDAGPLSNARWLETLGWWNIALGFKLNLGDDIGFRLVRPGTSGSGPRREVTTRAR